jgi:lipopolysaccharide biosynthesis glycosyltransferase
MNTITVVYASDNNYVTPTIVSITSILINKNHDTFYEIFILDDCISDKNKIKFNWSNFKDSYSIEFLQVDLTEFKKDDFYRLWAPATFARYFICDLLIEHDKCLWLDGDTIIQSDLTELYNTELNDNYLGGVKSPTNNYNVAKEDHTILSRDKYILKCVNAGVLLLNLKELRWGVGGGKTFLRETLNAAAALPPKSVVTDQDIFNLLLSDKFVYLPLKYNFYIYNVDLPYKEYIYPYCFSQEVIKEAFLHPAIIHYTVSEKPWAYSNAEDFYGTPYKFCFAIWQSYYEKSPISAEKLNKIELKLTKIPSSKIHSFRINSWKDLIPKRIRRVLSRIKKFIND